MRRILVLATVLVLGLSAAASATLGDQLGQFFSGSDAYSNGFRAGYAAGVADAANTAYRSPTVLNLNVAQCTQRLTLADFQQMAGVAQLWQTYNYDPRTFDPRRTTAAQLLGLFNRCSFVPGRDQGDTNR